MLGWISHDPLGLLRLLNRRPSEGGWRQLPGGVCDANAPFISLSAIIVRAAGQPVLRPIRSLEAVSRLGRLSPEPWSHTPSKPWGQVPSGPRDHLPDIWAEPLQNPPSIKDHSEMVQFSSHGAKQKLPNQLLWWTFKRSWRRWLLRNKGKTRPFVWEATMPPAGGKGLYTRTGFNAHRWVGIHASGHGIETWPGSKSSGTTAP